MIYNNNIINSILQDKFGDGIELYIADCVQRLDKYEIANVFEELVDYVQLDSISDMKVIDFEIEKEDDYIYISGTLDVVATINGYAHWDNEDVFLECGEFELTLFYQFMVKGSEYSHFELEYIY